MFANRLRAEYEAIIQGYKNDLADARAEIARLREEASKREKELLDRLIAVTNPPAARIFNPPPTAGAPSAPNNRPQGQGRIHWPASDFGTSNVVVEPQEEKK